MRFACGMVLFTSICVLLSSPVVAAPAEKKKAWGMDEVIVTASKIEENVNQTGSSVVVITNKEIETKRYSTVISAIKGKLGISSASSGPFGGTTDVSIRGTEGGHALVLIDGIRVYDAISADADFDLQNMPLDNVERIEILKGPQSSLYGSDAMGGVINIITKKGEGKPTFSLTTEVGTKDTYKESLAGYGSIGKFHYAADFSHLISDGVSKALGGKEQDGYQRTSFNAKMSYELSDNLEIGVQGMELYARSDGDDGASQDDPNRLFEFQHSLASAFANHKVNDIWEQKLQYSWFRNIRWDSDDKDEIDTTEANRSQFKGWIHDTNWQNNVDMNKLLSLDENIQDMVILGLQHVHETGVSTSSLGSNTPLSNAYETGYFIENKLGLNDKLNWTAAVRTDDHSSFGIHTTGRTTLSYLFETQTRLKGSYGTGYNAPSLFQLFSSFGDSALNAETSYGYDAGFEQGLFDEKVSFGSTFFYQRFKDLIEFNSSAPNPNGGTGRYVNVGTARSYGIENDINYRPNDDLTLSYGFTYLEAEDLDNGAHLRRKPNLSHHIGFDLNFLEKFNWNVDVTRNLKTYDVVRLKDYTVVDTGINYQIKDDISAYVKVENVFDESYQEVRGFSSVPRLVRVGTNIKF